MGSDGNTDRKPEDGLFDYSSVTSFAREYLSTYYTVPPTQDEVFLMDFLIETFKGIGTQEEMLEIGCGPTIHHAIPVAPYAEKIFLADYLQENLREVSRWRNQEDGRHDWSLYLTECLKREGGRSDRDAVQQREILLRGKLQEPINCNLLSDSVLQSPRRFSVVGSFFCAEEVGVEKAAWQLIMGRIASLIAPGGYLVMSALRGMDEYLVNGDGSVTAYPCANITEDDFSEVLPKLGFDMSGARIDRLIIEKPDVELSGVVAVAARKGG